MKPNFTSYINRSCHCKSAIQQKLNHSLCIEYESEFEFEPISDFYVESEFKFEFGSNFLGGVPLDADFLESECTNHVVGSTYTSDLLYEVQAEGPSSSSPTLVSPTV